MEFEKKVPEWYAQGTEPSESTKTTGFEAGYKPPAAFFNWFWYGVSACLKEIREKLGGHADNKENPHGVTAAQLGLDKVSNTPDTEKSVKFSQEAGEARKLQSSITIRFNGGRTENTDQWTFDGSTGRTVNITPAKIGAVEMKTATASLSASGWSSKKQTVSVSGVTASNTVIVTPAPSSHSEYNGCAVRCTAQASGTLTFTCTNVPTSDLTANVLILT